MTVLVAQDANLARVMLSPASTGNIETITVYYDGLVLVEGVRPLDELPQFDDSLAQQGIWGGIPFHNLLRNASGEIAGPSIRLWAKELSLDFSQIILFPTQEASILLDWNGAGWYYHAAAQNLLQTFWAKFGWGHIPLSPFTDQFYFLLQVLTLIGSGGAGIWVLRRGIFQSWNLFLFLSIVLAGIWVQTFLRGIPSLIGSVYLPPARYAYPVIIPTMLALNAGWLEIAHFLERWHLPHHVKFWVYGLFFLILDIASFWTVFYYYYIR
jgi:hypothetical protein